MKKLVSHTFEIEDTVKAFETAKDGSGNTVKVMIYCNSKDKNIK